MPATPAWPPSSAPRLFVDQPLSDGAVVPASPEALHYLTRVLRLVEGDAVRLFDDRTGEWGAELGVPTKRALPLHVRHRVGPRERVPDLWLCAAPVRRQRWEWVVEKATELGVARIVPVLTRRAVVDKVKPDRMRAIAIEAAEQCGRTALPELADATPLPLLLAGWDPARQLLHADEAGGRAVAAAARPGPAAILIGPEGGWADEERVAIGSLRSAVAVTLGPRVLRAETAALAAVTAWMAAAGDWVSSPGPESG